MKNKEVKFHLGAKIICTIFVVLGIMLIAISNIDFKQPFAWWASWGKASSNNAGTTLITAGIISFLVEISTLKNFMRDSLKNILNEDFPFETYSEDKLVRFRNLIAAYLSGNMMGTNDFIKKTIYKYEDKLLELTTKPYYEFHNATYSVHPDELNKRILIKATIDYKIINNFSKPNEIRFKTKTYGRNENEVEKNFNIKELFINNEEINVEEIRKIEKIEKQDDSNFYDYKIKINKKLDEKKKENIIHMKYEHYVPISDRLQNYKISLPCLKMEHEIRIKSNWNLRGTAYTAFYIKQDSSDSKFKIVQSAADLIRIKYNDWIFPGSGYSIYYDKDGLNTLHSSEK